MVSWQSKGLRHSTTFYGGQYFLCKSYRIFPSDSLSAHILSLRISFLFSIYKVCYIACKLFLKYTVLLWWEHFQIFINFILLIAAGIVESCKIMMNLFFSIRTNMPNVWTSCAIFSMERGMQHGLVERAQNLQAD